MKRKIIALIILTFVFSFNIALVQASSTSSTTLVPQGKAYDTGDYTLNDFVQLGINVTKIILGTVGSLALLMFVYGGVMMLISAGNSESVSKAKGIIMAAVIGLVIVFVSYTIVRFVIQALDGQSNMVGNWTDSGTELKK